MKQNLRRIQFAVMIMFMALYFAIASLTWMNQRPEWTVVDMKKEWEVISPFELK